MSTSLVEIEEVKALDAKVVSDLQKKRQAKKACK